MMGRGSSVGRFIFCGYLRQWVGSLALGLTACVSVCKMRNSSSVLSMFLSLLQ